MLKRLSLSLKSAAVLLATLLGWLFYLWPRSKSVWVLGAGQNKFIDNSRYLFLYLNKFHEDIRPVWLTASSEVIDQIRSMGFEAYHRWSLKGIWFALHAKYWFYTSYVSDINYYLCRGACLINLWHGIPFKKIEFDIDNGPLRDLYKNPSFFQRWIGYAGNFVKPDYLIGTSDYVANKMFSTAFRLPLERCLNFGLPRNDIFYQEILMGGEESKILGIQGMETILKRIRAYRRCCIYMPTWREYNPDFLRDSGVDFKRLDEKLENSQTVLLLKLHINTPVNYLNSISNLKNLLLLDSALDVYPLLKYTDVLITDYSSIAFDYLHLNKPMAFFVWDYDDYAEKSRSMYLDFEQYAKGDILRSAAAFEEYLEVAESATDRSDERMMMLNQYFSHKDGLASQRIVDFFKSLN